MHTTETKTNHTSTAVNKNAAAKIPFFQPKLAINQPNDIYEQEADAMADKVMRMKDPAASQTFFAPAISHVQRKCAACEEEEKKVQMKTDGKIIQRDGNGSVDLTDPVAEHIKEGDDNFQLQLPGWDGLDRLKFNTALHLRGVPFTQLYLDDADLEFDRQVAFNRYFHLGQAVRKLNTVPVLKYIVPDLEGDDPNKALANLTVPTAVGSYLRRDFPSLGELSDAPPIIPLWSTSHDLLGGGHVKPRRKCADCTKEDELQRKINSAESSDTNAAFENYVNNLNGSGSPLPPSAKQFFEPRFGNDFSGVRIHNNAVATKSASSINALAYTSGNNIVFNEGQYAPGTESGDKLLAHELTHVVQQKNNLISRQANPNPTTAATPIAKSGVPQQQGGFTLQIDYITITVLPDVYDSSKEPPHTSHTYMNFFPPLKIPDSQYSLDSKTKLVSSFDPYPALQIGLTVETNYAKGVNPTGPADYGYGTRKQDVKAQTTSLSFHEGSHGSEFIEYIRKEIPKYPLPKFEGKTGMQENDFVQKVQEYFQKISDINQMIVNAKDFATVVVDCAGISIDQHYAAVRGYKKICPP